MPVHRGPVRRFGGTGWGNAIRNVATAGRAIYKGVRMYRRYRAGGSDTRRNTTQSSAPPPVTAHYDSRIVYRKRRMPYRKKKQWIRTKRQVNAVLNGRLATNVLLARNFNSSVFNSESRKQNAFGITLNGLADLENVAGRVASLQPDNSILPTVGNIGRQKFVIVGSMTTVLMRNISEVTAVVDVYYWTTKRDVPLAEFSDINQLWSLGFGYNVANFPIGGSTLIHTDLGVTPWANPGMRRFLRIYQKRRIRLGAGADTELTLRTAKSYYSPGQQFMDQKSLSRGYTQGMLIVFHGMPGAESSAEPISLAVTQTSTHYYKVLQNAVMTSGDNLAL